MCGIAGILSVGIKNENGWTPTVDGMTEALRNRGPDGSGVWEGFGGRVCLGHRRLAIIDLSDDGAQPMVDAAGRYTITFNGEIYNYLEIKRELGPDAGIVGRSDTAVLLAAFRHWGIEGTLQRLVGMFALALWDRQEHILHLARDRAGKKPLYICRNQDVLYFASEIKALKCVEGLELDVAPSAVHHYLTLGYIPGPDTVYRQVVELLPGHWMSVDANLGARSQCYWQPPVGPRRGMPFEQAVEEVDHRLTDAVRLRLRADVPVGTFLSGGIDSGLITAMAARESATTVRTFTVGFDVGSLDEAPLARQVAERYATEHHEIRLKPNLEDLLPTVVRAYDEPIADTSILPTYAIAQEAGRHLKVVLNGEGADEIFGGYRRHLAVKFYQQFLPVLGLIPDKGWTGINRLLPKPKGFRTPYAFWHRFLRGFGQDPYARYLIWSSDGFDEHEKNDLLTAGTSGETTSATIAARHALYADLTPLQQFMGLDSSLAMADCLLGKLDTATMTHSLEARCPFLDHRLVDWCGGVDLATLMRGKTNKPILRELARRYLPMDLVEAPKRGFEIPLVHWMQSTIHDQVRESCLDPQGLLLEICSRKKLTDIIERRIDLDIVRWAKLLWILFMLASWDKEHNR